MSSLCGEPHYVAATPQGGAFSLAGSLPFDVLRLGVL
jgi:hypothetical protein